jgi:alkylation response protein AidB-like acyl-CoA dehydrogenase
MSESTDDLFADSVERLLRDQCTPAVVRAIEAGGDPVSLWDALAEAGFCDALVPEEYDGAGLGLAEALPMFVACGRHAMPLPLAQTAMVRGYLARAGVRLPDGPIAIAPAATVASNGAVSCHHAPGALVAHWVLAAVGNEHWLLPVADAHRTSTGIHGSLAADLSWPTVPASTLKTSAPFDALAAGALVAAAQSSGAMARVFDLTLAHANQRVQFGKPIGKFQAIQHQISVMAEHVAAARMAVELAASGSGFDPDPLRVAIAKGRIGEAIPTVAAIAHAVHGAIGITAEFDLQLYTRRLHEWRRAYGSEAYWYERVGRARLASDATLTVDFLRSATAARPTTGTAS